MRSSFLGLYDDARFSGRCILILDAHHEHLWDLGVQASSDFLEDAKAAARVIADVTDSPRVNYAVLGNTEPHLHWHLIPRQPTTEPLPSRPAWEHPHARSSMDPRRVAQLIDQIGRGLRGHL